MGFWEVEFSMYSIKHLHTEWQPVITSTAYLSVLFSGSVMYLTRVLWAEWCVCTSGIWQREVSNACLPVNSLRCLELLLACSLISTIPSFSSVYVSLWFAFPLQFIIKGDLDKCAGGFYKPHWPQRKSCPLTGAGPTSLYWLSCCQGYFTELWVSFITDKLLNLSFFKDL